MVESTRSLPENGKQCPGGGKRHVLVVPGVLSHLAIGAHDVVSELFRDGGRALLAKSQVTAH